MELIISAKPPGYESCLSEFKPCLFDSYCGEPVSWGFEITQYLGTDRFKALSGFGSLECSYPTWFLIVKTLTRAEAIEKFGPVTAEEYGPRGGWRSVMFGNKRFLSKNLRP
jgi:hypothetical protein